jgi:hypothetical protein
MKYKGQKVNHFTLLLRFRQKAKTFWRCQCICGKVIDIFGRIKHSCGCMRGHDRRLKRDGNLDMAAFRSRYNEYCSSAQRRGIIFDLTFEEAYILFRQSCSYCKQLPSIRIGLNKKFDHKLSTLTSGLDRVNNAAGYTRNNTVSCCTSCNYAKHTLLLSDFLYWQSQIIKFQGHSFFINKEVLDTYASRILLNTTESGSLKRKDKELLALHASMIRYVGCAKRRNILWSLTIAETLTLFKEKCWYCGASPSIKLSGGISSNRKHVFNKNILQQAIQGIDRVDSTKGYISNNVVPCCTICNRAKSTLSLVDFKAWIKNLNSYLGRNKGQAGSNSLPDIIDVSSCAHPAEKANP